MRPDASQTRASPGAAICIARVRLRIRIRMPAILNSPPPPRQSAGPQGHPTPPGHRRSTATAGVVATTVRTDPWRVGCCATAALAPRQAGEGLRPGPRPRTRAAGRRGRAHPRACRASGARPDSRSSSRARWSASSSIGREHHQLVEIAPRAMDVAQREVRLHERQRERRDQESAAPNEHQRRRSRRRPRRAISNRTNGGRRSRSRRGSTRTTGSASGGHRPRRRAAAAAGCRLRGGSRTAPAASTGSRAPAGATPGGCGREGTRRRARHERDAPVAHQFAHEQEHAQPDSAKVDRKSRL